MNSNIVEMKIELRRENTPKLVDRDKKCYNNYLIKIDHVIFVQVHVDGWNFTSYSKTISTTIMQTMGGWVLVI